MMMGGMSGGMSGGSMNAANMTGNMGQMMPMDPMSQMGQMSQMNQMNQMSQMAPMNQMSPMYQMGQMNPANQMGQMGQGGGYGSMYGMNDFGSQAGMGLGNFDLNTLISGLLNFGIKLFFLLIMVGLVVGTIVFLKQYLIGVNNRNPRVAAAGTGYACSSCGHALQSEWVACPKCGQKTPVQQRSMVLPAVEPQTV